MTLVMSVCDGATIGDGMVAFAGAFGIVGVVWAIMWRNTHE